ncbi:MAG: hypothetical protein ACJ780_20125 [Solirubrobacteraceae bacterium]
MELAGRWFGVRGRRFVRPALTLGAPGDETRALADLDDKPWPAEDGEVWQAAFSVDAEFDDAREIELSVAPDIVVELRAKGGKLAEPGDSLPASRAARAPRAKADAEPGGAPGQQSAGAERRRPLSPAAELQRLGARLAAANGALEQARERRAALAKTLEEERTANRQLRTELGQARAELEIAAAAQAAAAAVAAELEAARRELREAERRHEALVRQHEESTQALTGRHDETAEALKRRQQELTQSNVALRDELHQHAGALESARQALAEERAETGRLRNRLAQAQEARQRSAAPSAAAPAAERPSGPAADGRPARPPAAARPAGPPTAARPTIPSDGEARVSRRAASRAAEGRRPAEPLATQRFDVESIMEGLDTRVAPAAVPRQDSRRGGPPSSDPRPGPQPVADRLRPVNPSLRHRTNWFGRLLALLVLLGVIAAVWIVLHSTVLH